MRKQTGTGGKVFSNAGVPPRWVADRGGGGENVVQLDGMNLHATDQEGGLEVFLYFGFVMECGGSSYSRSWHSLLIYGRK